MSLSFGKIVSQLDLALDHLAQPEEDFARFALMLVDNVVEHFLHGHALYVGSLHILEFDDDKIDEKIVLEAHGKWFEPKVKLAKKDGVISAETAKSILHLHEMRNIAYHQGLSYANTIRSLTIFYFKIACELLQKESMPLEMDREIPYRAKKHFNPNHPDENATWDKLSKFSDALRSDLLGDLVRGMTDTIRSIDRMVEFCTTHIPSKPTRDAIVQMAQIESFVFSFKKRRLIDDLRAKQQREPSAQEVTKLILREEKQFCFADPVPAWKKKLQSLKAVKKQHAAVGIYCGFMEETADIREKIDLFYFGCRMESLRGD